jgi:signal transduction histidine kinase
MTKKSFTLSAEPVTWFRNKLRTDPFFGARVKILALYFITGALMFVGQGLISDYALRHEVYHIAVSQNGAPVRAAFRGLRQDLWLDRVAMALIFGCLAFLITEVVLRPIKKSAEIQKRFVAIVSHELRTPLTIMKNASEIGLRNSAMLSLEKATHIIESNLEETNRMSETISFLLAFSVLGERNHVISVQPVSLEAVSKEALAIIDKRYEKRAVHIELDATIPGIIKGDTAALKGLLLNLIENAVLHTPKGGRVEVSISKRGKFVQLAVSDTGDGIEKKDIPYIFQPFYRGDSRRSSESPVEGMGIGLSLVKEIADFHHASVHVASSKGQGSVFTVTFRA